MTRLFALFATLALIFTTPTFAGKKAPNRNWQSGKVLDSQRSQEFAGTVDRPGLVLTNGIRITNDSKRALYHIQQTIVIESETYTYTVAEALRRNGRPANLTVNGTLMFAAEDTILYIVDEDLREHKMEIVKKVLRKE
jgi:hypothetical protein